MSIRFFCFVSFSIVLLILASDASAQMQLGVNLGVNEATQSWDPAPGSGNSVGYRTGFSFGAQLDTWMTEELASSFQLAYDQKGATERTVNGDLSYSMNYIELPIRYKLAFTQDSLKPYIFLGAVPSVLVSASQSADGRDTDIKDSYFALDYAFLAGVGIALIREHGLTITAELTYAYGMSKIGKDYGSATYVGESNYYHPDIKSREIKLSISVLKTVMR